MSHFTIEDVTKFKKGLDGEDAQRWVAIANRVLEQKIAEDVPLLEAEVLAIRSANNSFSDKEGKGLSFSEMSEHEDLIFAEIGEGFDDGKWQLVVPVGTTYDAFYGEIILTKNFMQAMVDNQPALKNTKPFLNEQHDRGRALGWANEIRATDEGLQVKWEFTTPGKELIAQDIYKYYSGEIMPTMDVDTGENIYPTFRGAALTNSPVMKNMSGAHLADKKMAQGPKEKIMKFSEIKAEALGLSDNEKTQLVQELGYTDNSGEITALSEKLSTVEDAKEALETKVTELSEKLAVIDKEKVETFLSEAIESGKIKPADREKWQERLSKDYVFTSEVITDMPAVVEFGENGTGQDEEDVSDSSITLTNELMGRKPKKGE